MNVTIASGNNAFPHFDIVNLCINTLVTNLLNGRITFDEQEKRVFVRRSGLKVAEIIVDRTHDGFAIRVGN